MKVAKPMSRVLLGVLLIGLILGMTDGHWLILQSVAWTRMIMDYSRTSSLRTALALTFDGQHPCALCKQIQAAKHSSQHLEMQQPSVKLDDMLSETPPAGWFDPPCAWFPAAGDFIYPSRTDPPPVPPPRRPSGCS